MASYLEDDQTRNRGLTAEGEGSADQGAPAISPPQQSFGGMTLAGDPSEWLRQTTVMPDGGGYDPGGAPPGPTPPPGTTPGGGRGGGIVPGLGVPYDWDFGPAPQAGQGPAAPGMGPLTGQLGGYASNFMQNPSRFDTQLVGDISEAINHELGRAQQQQMAALDERMASRGLTGSNIEADQGRRIAQDIGQQRLQRLNALNMELARTHAQDRATAANVGLGVNRQTFGQGMQRAQFGEGQRRFDFGAQIRSRAQELQRQGMESDEAFRRAQLEYEQQYGQQRLGMEERLRQRDQRLQMLAQLLSVLGATGFEGESFEDLVGGLGGPQRGGPFGGGGGGGDPRYPPDDEEEEEDEEGGFGSGNNPTGDPRYP